MEEWRDIVGYEGQYLVSSYGNVKFADGREKHLRKDRNGYLITTLRKEKVCKTYKVHRLVATAFIDNPQQLPCVNHKDEVKTNNQVDNLEWCTVKYNDNYGHRNEKISKAHKGKSKAYMKGENNYFYGKHFGRGLHPHAKKVVQLDFEGKLLATFDCTIDAANAVGCTPSAIGMCCKGQRKQIKGYKWKYL